MNAGIRDVMQQLCIEMKEIYDRIDSAGDSMEAMKCLFDGEPKDSLVELLQDEATRADLLRIAQYSMTNVLFHILVIIDEKIELGESRVVPSLSLLVDGIPVGHPPMLHECFGAVMVDMGFDDTWYKMRL